MFIYQVYKRYELSLALMQLAQISSGSLVPSGDFAAVAPGAITRLLTTDSA
jgi:hypothetical protein